MFSNLWYQLRALFRRNAVEAELDEEVRAHVEQQAEKYVQAGMSPEEAARRARLEFGGVEQVKEECRDSWGVRFIMELGQDLRYGLRQLRRNPTFTVVAILTLALGIGANAAIFSLLNSLLLRDLPVPQPNQLVQFGAHARGDPFPALSLPMFEEIARDQKVLSGSFAWWGDVLLNIETNRVFSRADVWAVTGNFYSELGAEPEVGRLLSPGDVSLNSASAVQVAVLGYGFWQRTYGGERDIVGKTLKIEGIPFTIIGVTRKGFNGMSADTVPEITVPLTAQPLLLGVNEVQKHLQRPEALWLYAAGRLKPGVTLTQARAQLNSLWMPILQAIMPAKQTPAERKSYLQLRLRVESAATGNSYVRREVTKPIYVLLGITGVVMLLACVNLASLMLARAAARSHEFGVRVALGANRARLLRQVLVESVMLSVIGTLVGLVLATWGSRGLSAFILGQIYIVPSALNLSPDLRILGFILAVAIGTGVLFGLCPAWMATRNDPNVALQQESRTHGRRTGRLGKSLVLIQVALSLVLLAGAGLFIRTLQSLHALHPGFRTRGIVTVSLFPKPAGYRNLNWVSYYHELADRCTEIPGVSSVGIENLGLGSGGTWTQNIRIHAGSDKGLEVDFAMTMPGFFHTAGIDLLQGRTFTWQDNGQAPHVAIISRSLASKLFPDGGAINQTLDITTAPKWPSIKVVGIMADASVYDIREQHPFTVYVPTLQYPGHMGWSEMLIATELPPASIAPSIRRTVDSLGHEFVWRLRTVEQKINHSLLHERIMALLSALIGVLAIVIAGIGLFGLIAYDVTTRTHEIGIRMALGARKSDVLKMVVGQGLKLALMGVALGITGALALTRFLASLLYGVKPTDPVTFIAVSVILIIVALLACYIPARRAAKVDPMVALRYE